MSDDSKVPSDNNALIRWIVVALIGAGAYVGSNMLSDSKANRDFLQGQIVSNLTELGKSSSGQAATIQIVAQGQAELVLSVQHLASIAEGTQKWIEKLAKDQENGVWLDRKAKAPSPMPEPQH